MNDQRKKLTLAKTELQLDRNERELVRLALIARAKYLHGELDFQTKYEHAQPAYADKLRIQIGQCLKLSKLLGHNDST